MGIESRPSLLSDSRRIALADVAMAGHHPGRSFNLFPPHCVHCQRQMARHQQTSRKLPLEEGRASDRASLDARAEGEPNGRARLHDYGGRG